MFSQFSYMHRFQSRSGVVEYKPYTFIPGVNLSQIYGFDIEVLAYLENYLNFSTDLVWERDNDFGNIKDDGSWSGLIRMLMEGEVDFSTSLLTRTSLRSEFVDFSDVIEPFFPIILTKVFVRNFRCCNQ